jgi:HK97 family phage prohead protease
METSDVDCQFSRDAKSNPKNRWLFTREAQFSIVDRGNGMKMLRGYPITFNSLSDDRGGYFVRIMPGSPSFSAQIFAVTDHDYGKPLAVNDAGSLRIMREDGIGIPVEIDLPDVSYARDLQTLIAAKIVRGMSFAAIPETVKSHVTMEGGKKIVNFDSFCADEFTVTAIPAFMTSKIEIADAAAAPTAEEKQNAMMRLSSLEREQRFRLQRLKLESLKLD